MHLRDIIVDHQYRSGWAIGLFLLFFLGYRYFRLAHAVVQSQLLFWGTVVVSLVVATTYALSLIFYLFYPNYLDHFSATVSAISWLGTHSHEIYPDWWTSDIYEAPYGPLLFMTNGTVQKFLPNILGSKLSGCISFLVSLVFTYVIFKAKAGEKIGTVFVFLMIVITTYSFFHGTVDAFWNRAEPFLILLSVLSVIAAVKLPKAIAALTIGVLGGLAFDFKLHGFLYVVPAALAVCGVNETWKERVRLALVGSVAGGIAAVLPFLPTVGIVEGYVSVIEMTATIGLEAKDLLIKNTLFSLMLFIPIVTVWYFSQPLSCQFNAWFSGGLLMSLVILTIIASNPGAGPHHFLPLVPISAFGLLSVLEAPGLGRQALALNSRDVGVLVLVPLLIFYAPGELRWTKRFTYQYLSAQNERRKIEELQMFSTRYPLAEMGVSDNEHYADTYYRPVLVFRGAPLHVDFASWMDLSYAGVSERRIIGMLEVCAIPVWLLPEGLPFSNTNNYTGLPLLSENFRRTFLVKYRLTEIGQFYSVWKCL